jgi:hypothetical protein
LISQKLEGLIYYLLENQELKEISLKKKRRKEFAISVLNEQVISIEFFFGAPAEKFRL